MKKSVQLMLHFHWLRSRCLCKDRQTGEGKTIAMKPYCNKANAKWRHVATKPLQSDIVFNSSLFQSREISNNLVSFCYFFEISEQQNHCNCFFDLQHREYFPRSSHRPCKLGRYLDLGHFFSVQIVKTAIIALKIVGNKKIGGISKRR